MRYPVRQTIACSLLLLATSTGQPVARADDTLVISPEVAKNFAEYEARFRPVFFAVSADGMHSYYFYCDDVSCDTAQKTRNEAVQRCESHGGTDCRIFAVGRDVQVKYRVGDPATMVAAKDPPCVVESVAAGSPAATVVASLRKLECRDFSRFHFIDDFKAFATTDIKNPKNTWGWAYRYKDPNGAMKGALDQCDQSRKEESVADACRVFAIGGIVVDGMTDAQLRAAVELYKKNKEATNADLQ